jgi:hypothetical protein
MATKKTAAYEQFSKRLSKWVLIFWAAYRILTLVVAILRPDITAGLAALTNGVDDAAMCVVISYTVNSATEKVAINYFNAKSGERQKIMDSLTGNEDKEDDQDNKEASNG